jgi:hypothetical protein
MAHVTFEEVSYESPSLDKITQKWSDGSKSVYYKYRENPTVFEDWGFNGNFGALIVAAITTVGMAALIVLALI